MRRDLLFFSLNGGGVIWIFLLLLFGAGLSGCGLYATPTSQKPIVCTPQAPSTVNIYRTTPTPMQTSVPAPVTNGAPQTGIGSVPNNFTQEQVLALLQQSPGQPGLPIPNSNAGNFGKLVYETKNWSDIETVKLGDSSQAQIVVTFLSPQLIRTVYDNEMSSYGVVNPNAQRVLDKIAERDELIFFVTVITTTNNNVNLDSHKILIPIQQMTIMNADDVSVPPLHDDHNLAQKIDSTFEPVFGYLTYPIAMQQETGCSWILNPDYNKKIVIIVPNIYVDDVSAGSFTWVIPYSPLFDPEFPPPTPTAATFDSNQMSSSLTPPSPMTSLLVRNGMDESAFWQTYARFLWRQIVLGNY